MDYDRLYFARKRKLQEAGTVDVVLSFNNDYDRQENQSDFQMVCYDTLFLFGGELCFDFVWEWREARVWRECLVNSDLYALNIEVFIGLIQ